MLLDVAILLGLLVGIVVACTIFTNAIEWVGEELNLSAGAVGSVLAAVGTALPETIVPIVAIISGAIAEAQPGGAVNPGAGSDIGIGAILGAPFMLATLAMFISGLAILIFTLMGKRGLKVNVNHAQFFRDKMYFFIAFSVAILASFLPPEMQGLRWLVALSLLLLYGLYLRQTFQADPPTKDHLPDDVVDEVEPLYFAPKSIHPPMSRILIQAGVGLALIIFFAHEFVHEINILAEVLKINPLVLSLIIIPIATELPEKFNSVVWLSKNKDTLALGNLTGAMVFQSCIPVAVGVAFTPWVLNSQAMFSAVLTLFAALVISLFSFRLGEKATPFVFLLGGIAYGVFVYEVVKPLFG